MDGNSRNTKAHNLPLLTPYRSTMLLTLGASIYVVSKILGHKSIKMTEVYAKIVDKKKLETVNLVNGMFDQTQIAI